MASKYVDPTAIMQVIGCVFNNPHLLDFTDKYTITEDDFPDTFHQTVFGAIYKIHELGATAVTLENISDFFSTRPKSAALFKQHKGEEWLMKVADMPLWKSVLMPLIKIESLDFISREVYLQTSLMIILTIIRQSLHIAMQRRNSLTIFHHRHSLLPILMIRTVW